MVRFTPKGFLATVLPMTQPVTLPLWAFLLIIVFAAVTFASHFLFPSVRWFFRKRAERVIARLNTRLQRPIEPFKLARRFDTIQRLIYDPEVAQAVVETAREEGVPEAVAYETAHRYAREIVPSFSASAYFGFGIRFARFLSKSLYRIKLGAFDRKALSEIDSDATVIFVMNHRSNMDYVLVTYLAASAGTLSYAVGEWARVWPLSALIRAMGAYFIRRRSRGALYRKVLARYVQMATRGGVSQAVFPEGGLSLTGAAAPPRVGLISYVLEDFDPTIRDVIFVPVALNYDRVLEDEFLVAAHERGNRRFRPPLGTVLGGVTRHLWRRITGRFKGFGVASVSFGAPLTLSRWVGEGRDADPEALGRELMDRIAAVVPVLGVPLTARALVTGGPATRPQIAAQVSRDIAHCAARRLPRPLRGAEAVVEEALTALLGRGVLVEDAGVITIPPQMRPLLEFYANSISHHFDAPALAAPSA